MNSVITRFNLAACLIIISSSASAALITETWLSEITYTESSAFNLGDTFTWSVTYDNEAQIMSSYNDGVNGLAEFGEGDDTSWLSWCTSAYSGTQACHNNGSIYDSFYSNAVFDVSEFYSVVATAGHTGRDNHDNNRSIVYDSYYDNTTHYQLISDDFSFTEERAYIYSNGPVSEFWIDHHSSLVSIDVHSIPEPPAIALFTMGLAGIVIIRRKKHIPQVNL